MYPWLHALFLVFMGFFAGIGLLILKMGGRGHDDHVAWYALGFMELLALLLYVPLVWYQRVKLGPRGVLVRALGCHVATSWENVERFHFRDFSHVGLVTRQPLVGKDAEKLRQTSDLNYYGLAVYDESERRWLRDGRYLPLKGFYRQGNGTSMQRVIQSFSPGLQGLQTPEGTTVIKDAKAG